MRLQVYLDALNQWRWRAIAVNGRILADSGEGYYNRADCEHAIQLIRAFFKRN